MRAFLRRLLGRETQAERIDRLLERDYWRRVALDRAYREGRISHDVYWQRTRALDVEVTEAMERVWEWDRRAAR